MRDKKALLVHIQRAERQELKDRHRIKRHITTKTGRDKFRRGIMGFFDKVTGKEKRLRLINKKEVTKVKRQQSNSRQNLVFRHNMERSELQGQIEQVREKQQEERKELALRIHEMRNSREAQEMDGLSRDFNSVVLDRVRSTDVPDRKRTHSDASSNVRRYDR